MAWWFLGATLAVYWVSLLILDPGLIDGIWPNRSELSGGADVKRSIRHFAILLSFSGLLVSVVLVSLRQEPADAGGEAKGISQVQRTRLAEDVPLKQSESTHDMPAATPGISQRTEAARQTPESDGQADLLSLRQDAREDVLVTYSLMLRQLGLHETEMSALTDFLVEVWMSSTWTRNYRPQPIEEGNRRAGIAAIIGDDGLERMLAMELNMAEYRETGHIAKLLRANDVPLSDAQQERLLDILIQVGERQEPFGEPGVGAETLEFVESRMAAMNEYERLVIELAPSVLSARQTELLYGRYEAFSRRRARILEMQKRTRANESAEDDFPLVYPARN